MLKKTTIPHRESELGLFSACAHGKKMTIGYYYGSWFMRTVTTEWYNMKTYGKVVMQVTTETFLKQEKVLREMATEKDGTITKMLVVEKPFCATVYMNESRYWVGDTTLGIEGLNNPKKKNVQFLKCRSLSSSNGHRSISLFSVVPLHYMAVGEDLQVY